jgi:hypothetical protein
MKHKILTVLFMGVLFASCKKDSTTNNNNNPPVGSVNTITATIKGVTTTWNDAIVTNGLGSFTGDYILTMASIDHYPNTIEVKVESSDSIQVKAPQSFSNTTSANPDYILYGAYISYSNYPSGTINITSFTAANIQGTFTNCTVYNAGGNINDSVTIASGTFNVNF